MNRSDLLKFIRKGENSSLEFKRDNIRPQQLAREMVGLLNLRGGFILLGVEDDGSVSGLRRSAAETERWVMETARAHIYPPFLPGWEAIECGDDGTVGIVHVSGDASAKPYKAKLENKWITLVRAGSTTREASRDEEGRLYQFSGLVHYDIKPVLDTGVNDLDLARIDNYFRVVRKRDVPSTHDVDEWRRILTNIDVLVTTEHGTTTTVSGLLLFGKYPNRRLPQAGITAVAFAGREKDYDTIDEEIISGPLVPMLSDDREIVDMGVIDRAIDFVLRNMGRGTRLDGGRRIRMPAFSVAAVREAIVNAVAHRDYSYVGTDIEISLYRDRLEVISPGRLPNGITVTKMKEGARSARNAQLKEVLRDYRYVEHYGMGVRNRIIKSMIDHNGIEPDLIEEEHRFRVHLWRSMVA